MLKVVLKLELCLFLAFLTLANVFMYFGDLRLPVLFSYLNLLICASILLCKFYICEICM